MQAQFSIECYWQRIWDSWKCWLLERWKNENWGMWKSQSKTEPVLEKKIHEIQAVTTGWLCLEITDMCQYTKCNQVSVIPLRFLQFLWYFDTLSKKSLLSSLFAFTFIMLHWSRVKKYKRRNAPSIAQSCFPVKSSLPRFKTLPLVTSCHWTKKYISSVTHDLFLTKAQCKHWN